ncbi:hypothetical protein EWM64_g2791 [Hericium alpestre]|uniref:Autophagy-related protein 27 n=1 Tax=Hericium alpestre TaxID=135208 RepID=A0A4Z0A5M1_9AGAM|nr:hypothetical protein EWM64_g2791 [Hericium alpestre]
MFTTLFTATLLSVAAVRGVRADFAINSPELVQCQDAHVSWQPTNAPYNLIVVPGEDACSDALADLGDHNGTTMTWNVHLPAGTKVMLSLEDATTDEAWSQVLFCAPSPHRDPEHGYQQSRAPRRAANAAANPLSNGGLAMRQLYTPAMLFSALGAAVFIAL